MMRYQLLAVLAAGSLGLFATFASAADDAKSVLDFKVKDIDGKDVDLAQYKGKVLLIVNTASQCGYTPQYEGLEALYKKYADQGFAVLAFPANEFGNQEPGSDTEIKSFCKTKYDVTFPLFSKIVVKGQGTHPLYKYLTSPAANAAAAGDVKWNFTKFLVDKDGKVAARFEPGDKPESPKVAGAIESALKK